MRTTIGISHFFINNTPKTAQIVGDIALTLAVVAGIPLVLQQSGMAVPAQITTIASWAVAAGAIVKFVSKTFGITDDNGNPVVQSATK